MYKGGTQMEVVVERETVVVAGERWWRRYLSS